MGHITLSLMDPAKSNNRYCCCVPWAGDGGLSVHESLGSQLLPEKNVQGRKDVLVWPCVCFRCHCTHCARLMLLSDPSMAAALEKHMGKSEYLLLKVCLIRGGRRGKCRHVHSGVGKAEINGSNERHQHRNKPGLLHLVMRVVQQL